MFALQFNRVICMENLVWEFAISVVEEVYAIEKKLFEVIFIEMKSFSPYFHFTWIIVSFYLYIGYVLSSFLKDLQYFIW